MKKHVNFVLARIAAGVLAVSIVIFPASTTLGQSKIIRPTTPQPRPDIIRLPRPQNEAAKPIEVNPEVMEVIANSPLLEAPTVDAFIEALPDWKSKHKIKPSAKTESPAGESRESKDGRDYNVIRTNYSLTETPEEIVTYQPVNAFWLGALVQGQGLQNIGSMQEIAVPAEKRAPFKITVNLPMTANFRTITAPSTSTVGSALGDLMRKGSSTGWGGARTLKIVDNYSEEQVAQELGISARYMTAKSRLR